MTPKEKAQELIEKMKRNISYYGQVEQEWIEDAKECAIIAVDEILSNSCICLDNSPGAEPLQYLICYDEYWQEVKQHIQEL